MVFATSFFLRFRLLGQFFRFAAYLVRKNGAKNEQACIFLVTSRSLGVSVFRCTRTLTTFMRCAAICHGRRTRGGLCMTSPQTLPRQRIGGGYVTSWRSRLACARSAEMSGAGVHWALRQQPHRSARHIAPLWKASSNRGPRSFHPEPHGNSHGSEEEPGINSSRPVTLASALRRPCGGVLPANRRRNLLQGREVPRRRLGQGHP